MELGLNFFIWIVAFSFIIMTCWSWFNDKTTFFAKNEKYFSLTDVQLKDITPNARFRFAFSFYAILFSMVFFILTNLGKGLSGSSNPLGPLFGAFGLGKPEKLEDWAWPLFSAVALTGILSKISIFSRLEAWFRRSMHVRAGITVEIEDLKSYISRFPPTPEISLGQFVTRPALLLKLRKKFDGDDLSESAQKWFASNLLLNAVSIAMADHRRRKIIGSAFFEKNILFFYSLKEELEIINDEFDIDKSGSIHSFEEATREARKEVSDLHAKALYFVSSIVINRKHNINEVDVLGALFIPIDYNKRCLGKQYSQHYRDAELFSSAYLWALLSLLIIHLLITFDFEYLRTSFKDAPFLARGFPRGDSFSTNMASVCVEYALIGICLFIAFKLKNYISRKFCGLSIIYMDRKYTNLQGYFTLWLLMIFVVGAAAYVFDVYKVFALSDKCIDSEAGYTRCFAEFRNNFHRPFFNRQLMHIICSSLAIIGSLALLDRNAFSNDAKEGYGLRIMNGLSFVVSASVLTCISYYFIYFPIGRPQPMKFDFAVYITSMMQSVGFWSALAVVIASESNRKRMPFRGLVAIPATSFE